MNCGGPTPAPLARVHPSEEGIKRGRFRFPSLGGAPPRQRGRGGLVRARRLAAGLWVLACMAACGTSNDVSLIPNGGFEEADAANPGKPAGWDVPDGLGVQWVEAEGGGSGKAIRMDTAVSEKDMVASWRKAGLDQWDVPKATGDAIAATYGLSYYSDWLPVVSGQVYRVRFRWKGPGGAKVWVRGYGLLRGEPRHIFDALINGEGGQDWTAQSQTFHPTRRTPHVTRMRVMLYAYWPPGVYWFDDVRLETATVEEWEKESGLTVTNMAPLREKVPVP